METHTAAVASDILIELREQLRRFAAERDWEQFHAPKNLAMALAAEAGEVLEHFLWLSAEASGELPADKLAQVRLELADVLLYLVRLADRLGIDLGAAAADKITLNARRYPVDKSRGTAKKYTEL